MKLKTTLAVILGVGLSPALAFCAEGAAGGGGSWFALIFYVINFAIFVFLMVHYAGPYVVKFFRERSREIREQFKVSETSLRNASQTAEEAEAEIAHLEAEKARILTEMRAETAREISRLRDAGKAGAERIRRDGELTASSLVENGRRIVQAHLASTAVRLARDLIIENFEPADQTRLVREFLQTVTEETRS
jgi:F0F1-type ATP synthase membrane subunit b/b'